MFLRQTFFAFLFTAMELNLSKTFLGNDDVDVSGPPSHWPPPGPLGGHRDWPSQSRSFFTWVSRMADIHRLIASHHVCIAQCFAILKTKSQVDDKQTRMWKFGKYQ